jgi:membrane fusion protein, copper/silver efflux system
VCFEIHAWGKTMKPTVWIASSAVLVAAALAAGYWWGMNRPAAGLPGTAAAPKADGIAPGSAPAATAAKPRILHYRNPMGLADTSPVPKKDSMGMDYIPVYDGDEPAGPGLKISLDRVQKLGVRTEPAAPRALSRTVRAVGTVQVNERLEHTVSPKFEGWIQLLLVSTVGERVYRGQPLMRVYSPDLVAMQQDYLIAMRGLQSLKNAGPEVQANMKRLRDSSLQRMRNWDISFEDLMVLQQEGAVLNAIMFRSPVNGVVIAKSAEQGMRFLPGEKLYRIADLSSLWLLAEVFEQDMAGIQAGQSAQIRVNAYPEKVFAGTVAFVYPTVTPETRTARLRIEIGNIGGLLKPDMYANVELATGAGAGKRLSIPDSAVLDSGTRQLVLVQRGEGLFDPREVKLGRRGDGYVEVLEGLKSGELVVVSANFLIDSESNLKAAVGAFTQPASGAFETRHAAEGKVESVDPKAGTVSIAHGPVASLKWPGMSMEFKVKDPALLAGMRAGANIGFEFAEASSGEWIIVGVTPLAPAAAKAGAARDSRTGR